VGGVRLKMGVLLCARRDIFLEKGPAKFEHNKPCKACICI
jgi:hypothetical protein